MGMARIRPWRYRTVSDAVVPGADSVVAIDRSMGKARTRRTPTHAGASSADASRGDRGVSDHAGARGSGFGIHRRDHGPVSPEVIKAYVKTANPGQGRGLCRQGRAAASSPASTGRLQRGGVPLAEVWTRT